MLNLYQIRELYKLGRSSFAIRYKIHCNLEQIEEIKQLWIIDFKNKEFSKVEFRKKMSLIRETKKHCLKLLDLSSNL